MREVDQTQFLVLLNLAIIYNLILAIFAGAALIIPFTGKVYDGRFRWFKSFTIRGWVLLVAVLGSVIITYLKDLRSEKDDIERGQKVKNEQRQRDLDNRKLTDQSNAKIVITFTNALAEYGLKYDSSQRIIQQLVKDSSKKEIKYTYGNHPELSVCNIELSKNLSDSISFNITLCVKQAMVYHLNLKNYLIVDEYGKPFFMIPEAPDHKFTNDVQIGVDNRLILDNNLSGSRELDRNKLIIYFQFIGTYKDLDGKAYRFESLYSYDFDRKRMLIVMDPIRTALMGFLKTKGVSIMN